MSAISKQSRVLSVLGLMAITACFGLVFALIRESRNVPIDVRMEAECEWVRRKPTALFWPTAGTSVMRDDPVLKIAWSTNKSSALWLITKEGEIENRWHYGFDAGGGKFKADQAGLAKLAELLKALPPNDPTATERNCVVVAYRDGSRWSLRWYPIDAKLPAVNDLAKALNLLSSFDEKVAQFGRMEPIKDTNL